MSIDESTLRDLIDLSDPLGVLSVYVENSASQAADPQPTAPLEIRRRSEELTSELAERDPSLARAVEERLASSEADLSRILDPKTHGRGRAFFVGVGEGATASIRLQIPFRHRVVHHDSAYIRPLVAAYDEGRDAGVLILSRKGARVLRWSLGEAEELDDHRFVVFDEQASADKSGPSPANPQDPRQGVAHRDDFEDRIDANHQRFLRDVTEEATQLAKRMGWDRLIVSGPPKVRSAAREMLPSDSDGLQIVVADRSWEDSAPHEIADQAWPFLRSVHEERARRLIETTKDRALSGGAGALGLGEVCDALNEGRVSHLLYDDAMTAHGFRSDEGTLHADESSEMAGSEVPLRAEPLLIERMVEKAIGTSASVTPLNTETAALLEEHGGIAALLRW
jgi:peptide subunit release factor 1 (eRF1)